MDIIRETSSYTNCFLICHILYFKLRIPCCEHTVAIDLLWRIKFLNNLKYYLSCPRVDKYWKKIAEKNDLLCLPFYRTCVLKWMVTFIYKRLVSKGCFVNYLLLRFTFIFVAVILSFVVYLYDQWLCTTVGNKELTEIIVTLLFFLNKGRKFQVVFNTLNIM